MDITISNLCTQLPWLMFVPQEWRNTIIMQIWGQRDVENARKVGIVNSWEKIGEISRREGKVSKGGEYKDMFKQLTNFFLFDPCNHSRRLQIA